MKTPSLRLAALALIALTSPAHAALTFDFQDHRGPLGSTQAFSSKVSATVYDPTYQITANGMNGTVATALYVKNSGGDESGLGIASDSDREIAGTNDVEISVADLKKKFAITSLGFALGSVQGGEGYVVTAGSIGGPIVGRGATDGTVVITGANLAYNDFFIKASTGNVLVDAVTVGGAAVPEPASLAMTAIGVGASLVGYGLKRRRSARA